MSINRITNAITKTPSFGATKSRESQETSQHYIVSRRHNPARDLKIEDYAFEAALMINLIIENARKRNISLEDEFLRVRAAMPLVKKSGKNDNHMLNYQA